MASLKPNNNQVKQSNASKKVVANKTVSTSANVTNSKTPVANQNVGVKEDIRHNDSVPKT